MGTSHVNKDWALMQHARGAGAPNRRAPGLRTAEPQGWRGSEPPSPKHWIGAPALGGGGGRDSRGAEKTPPLPAYPGSRAPRARAPAPRHQAAQSQVPAQHNTALAAAAGGCQRLSGPRVSTAPPDYTTGTVRPNII